MQMVSADERARVQPTSLLNRIAIIACLAWCSVAVWGAPFDEAIALAKTGLQQQEHGEYAASEVSFRRAVEIYEREGVTADPRLAQALNGLGAAQYYRGRHREAELFYRRALAIFEQLNQPGMDWAATMKNLCTLHRERADLTQAEAFCSKAVTMMQDATGDSPESAAAYAELAMIAKARGDLRSAERLIHHAEELQTKSAEPNRLPLWTLWGIEGEILNSDGRWGEAEALYRRALADCSHALGAANVRCAAALNGLGLSLASREATAGARQALERALHIFESNYGPDHQRVAAVLTNLGTLASSMGDYSRAQKYLERAAAISEKVMGPDHPDTAATLMNLAGVYLHRRKFDQAEPLFVRAVAIDQRNGAPARKLAVDLNNLGAFFFSTRQWDRSEEAFLRSIQLYEQCCGGDSVALAGVLGNLAEGYRVQGRDRDAIAAYRRAMAIWDQHRGIMSRETANFLDHYAQLMRKSADYAEANRAEAEAMRIRVKNAMVNGAAGSSLAAR